MREFKFLYAFALITALAATAGACAQSEVPAPIATVSFTESSLPSGKTLSGGYLAGRFAQRQQDWDAAQNYMGGVLAQDRENDLLMQRTFLLALGSGNFSRAKSLAEKVSRTEESAELALIFLSCDAISRDNFTEALGYLNKLPTEGFGQYTKPLLTAWSLVGLGKKDEAMALLSANADPTDPTYLMHVGMMEELAGNMEAAKTKYKAAMASGLDLHTAVMVGNFFERYGQPEVANSIYRSLDTMYPLNPFISAMAARDPKRIITPNIARVADGAALVMFDLAALLHSKRAYDSARIYGSMVQILDPQSAFAKLLMGDIAALHNQYSKAIDDYNAIDAKSPVFWLSRMRLAEAYEASGQLAQSIGMLTDMSKTAATRTQALVALGDIYRRNEQFITAIDAYDQALAGLAPVTEDHWPILYARGIARERVGQRDLAEKDLLQALSFQPDNPTILNFIAYSWATQGIHLDKALVYAKQAATIRPDDGYILDSYGWTLFRLAKYEEAIIWLEQAVEQVPNDSTLLDHLGDAYWQIGRKNEARHQWKHANDLSQDPSFKTLVQKKIEHGIVVPSQVEHKQAKL